MSSPKRLKKSSNSRNTLQNIDLAVENPPHKNRSSAAVPHDSSEEDLTLQQSSDNKRIDFKHFKKSRDFLFATHNKQMFAKGLFKVGQKRVGLISKEIAKEYSIVTSKNNSNGGSPSPIRH